VSFAAAVCVALCVAAGATAATPLTLQERALRSGELAGFTVKSRPPVVTSLDEWSERFFASPPTLRQDGFARGLREKLHATAHGLTGYSSIAEFRTATGARDEVTAEIAQLHATVPTYVSFPVAGIPGADGFMLGDELCYVMFNDGRFQYGLGAGGNSSATMAPTKAQVIAAAKALYRRVQGR
jgi:hypothetical protein